MRRIFVFFVLGFVLWSCNNDDDNENETETEIDPPRPPGEVTTENDSEIEEYLKTHFYSFDESADSDSDFKIKISKIQAKDSLATPMIEQVKAVKISIADSVLTGANTGNTEHTYYYITVREGLGESPTVADSTLLRYEGSLLNGAVFDASLTYNWQYLGSFIRGFSDAASKFNAGTGVVENPNGTVSIKDSGLGIMILPSALAYFNQTNDNIPTFSPLVFTFEIGLFIKDTDFDNDGVPSIMEDVNGDGYLNNDNTDGDSVVVGRRRRPLYNHQDPDDDNDGIPTREEVEFDDEGNLILPLPDADNDGTPDYLDADS